MESSRRWFLRGLASVAGAAGAATTASAQHEGHQQPAPVPSPAGRRASRPAAPVPPDTLGPGVVPVLSPDVPDMPWRLEGGVKVFNNGLLREATNDRLYRHGNKRRGCKAVSHVPYDR